MREPKISEQYLSDGSGKRSMMRLIAYHGARTARHMIYAGLGILIVELFVMKTGTTAGVTVMGLGAGVYGVGEGAKAWQSGKGA